MIHKRNKLKIAIVHDYLRTYGGGERVLEELHSIWPEAQIYTATADYKRMGIFGNKFKKMNIKTSWAQNIYPFVKKPLLYRPLLPFIWSTFNLKDVDIVISSSGSNMAKNVKTPSGAVHVCYCYTPPRFLYNIKTENPILHKQPLKIFFNPIFKILKKYDLSGIQKINILVAISKTVQFRITKHYKRNSIIIYPPCQIPQTTPEINNNGRYFIVVSRLVKYKNIDLIIKTFNKISLPLFIVGRGRDENKLHKLAKNNSNITFFGEVDDQKLHDLYKNCKALIVATSDEDFGMTIPEAAGYGKPAIAYYSGGARETVQEGKTGIFFRHLTITDLKQAIVEFERLKFDPVKIWKYSLVFSKKAFRDNIQNLVKQIVNK